MTGQQIRKQGRPPTSGAGALEEGPGSSSRRLLLAQRDRPEEGAE